MLEDEETKMCEAVVNQILEVTKIINSKLGGQRDGITTSEIKFEEKLVRFYIQAHKIKYTFTFTFEVFLSMTPEKVEGLLYV